MHMRHNAAGGQRLVGEVSYLPLSVTATLWARCRIMTPLKPGTSCRTAFKIQSARMGEKLRDWQHMPACKVS